jgi:DNA-binding SARP family transcriptional activator
LSSKLQASRPLFRAAIEAGIAPDYLTQMVPAETVEMAAAAAAAVAGVGVIGSPPVVQPVIERPAYDLAIDMLGPVEVFRDPSGMAKEAWRLSKSLHILSYLCSRRNHRAPKETLVDLFWSGADEETVAKNFHPTISHLRKALNTGQVVKKDFVLYREGAYFLNPEFRYRLDTEEFERLLAEAREARRTGGADASAQLLTEAIKLYRGDFLEELYYNWIEELQSYYRDLYLEALKELIAYHSQPGDYENVIRYGQMFLGRDPYQEDVHCHVMEAFVQSGNRAAAIEQFDGLRKMLRRELGVDPLPATIAKYEALIK